MSPATARHPAGRIEVLYFDGCPSTDAFLPQLRELLARVGAEDRLELRRVETIDAAERERFLGSPSVRIDGRDIEPGADDRTDYGMKCRLYRTASGMRGEPPEEWVLAALGLPAADVYLAISGDWASRRLDGLTGAARGLHRQILRAFADGTAPTAERLAEWAVLEDVDVEDAMSGLAARDLVHRHPGTGTVAVAYPFSAAPTRHRVRLSTGVEVFAMCAIDALGIAFMLDQPTTVRSADPETAQTIEVTVRPNGASEWTPADAGVVLASAPAVAGSQSARCTCPHTNFTASRQSGTDWLDRTGEITGQLLSMPDAIATARETFGMLLSANH